MVTAINVAAAGLLSSANQATAAAQKILVATKPPATDFTGEAAMLARGNAAYLEASGNSAGRLGRRSFGGRLSTVSTAASGLNSEDSSAPSPEEAIVNLKVAATAYKANAAVLKSVNQSLGSLMEIKT